GGEAQLGGVVEVLVAEDQGLVLQERRVDLGEHGGVELAGEVRTEDLGADAPADPADVEGGTGGHGTVPFVCRAAEAGRGRQGDTGGSGGGSRGRVLGAGEPVVL